ncbi:MAG: S8 family serine peptidase [Thaumarchaeota archaeon]|nr:S8 family serine peptidase [Nitrososphaerota archaeon]
MRIAKVVVLLLVVVGTSVQLPVYAQGAMTPVLVLFAPKVTHSEMLSAVASAGGTVTRAYSTIPEVAAVVPESGISDLQRNPLILAVDEDAAVHPADSGADTQISANQVWSLGLTGSGVKLAVLDTGIDTTHPEFSGRILACASEVKGARTCEDDNGHGTHVAGIAGASGVDPLGKGVAPSVSFMIDKILDKTGSGSLSQVISGIDWAVANGAQIISMSLGTAPVDAGGTLSNCDSVYPTFTVAINDAVAAGVTVVAAAGNSGTGGLGAPGCISSVIAVGAVDSTDTLAWFSSQGAAMKDHGISAPGVNIYSSWLNGGYKTLSGTSMATPMVSGTIALMLTQSPGLTPTEVRTALFSTAKCLTSPCPNTMIGYGRVDSLKATNAGSTTPPPPTSLTVALSTDRAAYTLNSWANVNVVVTDSTGQGTPGMLVAVEVTSPSGQVWSSTGSTDSSGSLSIRYRIMPHSEVGTYKVQAVVLSSSGACTFQVS